MLIPPPELTRVTGALRTPMQRPERDDLVGGGD
jgi:hypothetical protein